MYIVLEQSFYDGYEEFQYSLVDCKLYKTLEDAVASLSYWTHHVLTQVSDDKWFYQIPNTLCRFVILKFEEN